MTVCYEKESVETITLSRPNAKNYNNTQLVGELNDIRNKIYQNKPIMTVINTGEGKEIFCALPT